MITVREGIVTKEYVLRFLWLREAKEEIDKIKGAK
jgi:hypothetical protein